MCVSLSLLMSSVAGEPRHKVALWVLESSAGNHKVVRRREIYQAVTINAPRAGMRLAPTLRMQLVQPR